jgi:hypothetical protein
MTSVAAADDAVPAGAPLVATAEDAVPTGAPVVASSPAPAADAILPPAMPNAAYGREGTIESGASAGLALGQGSQGFSISAFVARYISERFALSGILDATTLFAGGGSATNVAALVEPSLHVPIKPTMNGFVGMGIGPSYIHNVGTAVAVAPHLGMDIFVGDEGILRPSLTYLYTTHDTMAARGADGTTHVTYLAAASAIRFNVGYLKWW